jgi:hypothetical protein
MLENSAPVDKPQFRGFITQIVFEVPSKEPLEDPLKPLPGIAHKIS